MRQIRKRLSNKFRWPFFFCDNFCLEYMKSVLNDYLCTKKIGERIAWRIVKALFVVTRTLFLLRRRVSCDSLSKSLFNPFKGLLADFKAYILG